MPPRDPLAAGHAAGVRPRRALVWPLLAALLAAAARAADPAPADRAPKYGPRAVRLFLDREYVRRAPAPDFWALLPYYVPQATDSACSTAVAAMVLNALRAGRALGADERLATHAALLEGSQGDAWRRAVAPGGEGVGLDSLAGLLRRALPAYGLGDYRVDVVHTPPGSAESIARVRQALELNEASDADLIVVNFLQSTLTGDPDGAVGHYAPIAAYDAERHRALILDPDRDWYEPYWVPESALIEAMATRDSSTGPWRGFLWIRRPAPAGARSPAQSSSPP